MIYALIIELVLVHIYCRKNSKNYFSWFLIDYVLLIWIGHTPLSWIMRVQIALDAAKGLEYIHEHTRPHYVHRDIKTSNIMLDGSLRAKVRVTLPISSLLKSTPRHLFCYVTTS